MKSEQAFVHIGLEKTGSTFLQDFLYLNNEKLVKLGLYKSKALQGKNHFRLALLGQDKNSKANHINDYCNLSTDLVEDSNKSLLSSISKVHISGCRFIASSELISSNVLKVSEIERFKDNIGQIFNNVKILIFIRRQEHLLISRYTTAMIHGFHRVFPNNIENIVATPAIDLITILNTWQTVFEKNLCVLPYFEDSARRDVVYRFFTTLGVLEDELKEFAWPETRSNSSMSATGLETLRRFNEKTVVTPSDMRKQIISYIQDRTSHEGKFALPDYFHEQVATKFMAANEEASVYLDPLDRERFLNGQSLDSQFSTSPNVEFVEELLEEIVRIFYKNDLSISKILLQ